VILYRTMIGRATAKTAQASGRGRSSLRPLVDAGLIERPPKDTDLLQLSADVRESLLLDDYPEYPIGTPRAYEGFAGHQRDKVSNFGRPSKSITEGAALPGENSEST
jgi:hypothetical protein